MNVEWSATSPSTGRYSGLQTTSTQAELLNRLNELRARGGGYIEVRMQDQDYPLLSLAFQGDQAVVERWLDQEHMALLGGDGSVPMDEDVEVPIEDDEDPGTFTGEFVSTVDRAFVVVQRFIQDGDTEFLGDWYDL